MNSPPLLPTLKLDWEQVASCLSVFVSSLLDREIVFRTAVDDYDYWTGNCINDRFSLADLCFLLSHVRADRDTCIATIPSDDLTTVGIDMSLANLLLAEILHTDWEGQLIRPEYLYLIGVDPDKLIMPEGGIYGEED